MPVRLDSSCLNTARDHFNEEEFKVWRQLAEVKVEIAERLRTSAQSVPKRWVNEDGGPVTPGYGNALYEHMQLVNKARKKFTHTIKMLGGAISSLHRGTDWFQYEHLVQLRQELVHVVQELRHDPHKGPGMAFFNLNGELITYAAGSLWRPTIQWSREEQIELLEARSRFGTAMCGERTVIAELTKRFYPAWKPYMREIKHGKLTLQKGAEAYMAAYSGTICAKADKATSLNESTLQVSVRVCGFCANPIIRAGVARIIVDQDASENGMRHIRQTSMDDAVGYLRCMTDYSEIPRKAPIRILRCTQ